MDDARVRQREMDEAGVEKVRQQLVGDPLRRCGIATVAGGGRGSRLDPLNIGSTERVKLLTVQRRHSFGIAQLATVEPAKLQGSPEVEALAAAEDPGMA